jgi:hypothetical protein
MTSLRKVTTTLSLAIVAALSGQAAIAGVDHKQMNSTTQITFVSEDPWQPEDFVNGKTVPATWMPSPVITIDGVEDEAAWAQAPEVEVTLSYGDVDRAWLKAVYTDQEVFIRVRWADSSENREHHPWAWDAGNSTYVPGPQVEDSVMLSFEAGCEWNPSLLGGAIYDFDAWHWMAARSDPLDQAIDLYGNVRSRDTKLPGFYAYPSRVTQQEWELKFTENQAPELHADWSELDRVYIMQPVTKDLWVRATPDGGRHAPAFVEQLPAPVGAPTDGTGTSPQFSPVKLTGEAAEVAASGQWKDGYWTVEFRRDRVTPVKHIYDTMFNRLVQFSVHVFDQVEQLDQSSESQRLFLQFLPPKQELANKP